MSVVWLFLAVPLVCLQFVIVVFPDHTHLLFMKAAINVSSYMNTVIKAVTPSTSVVTDIQL